MRLAAARLDFDAAFSDLDSHVNRSVCAAAPRLGLASLPSDILIEFPNVVDERKFAHAASRLE